ncbi:MAG: ABC transporter ATP-binding protein [Clostridiales bacterium]|jgi:ATP-binding cassette subfamily B multidrug efflux pump|nr:ABC transporter ATP-binding protein [Clostridiales bacterium]MDU6854731.1 ABC transporter ATP-binding protein [Clostridiales bacterium]MDU6974555.1 ABC transporter ATP-binding protein [Clostridiales bacterium]
MQKILTYYLKPYYFRMSIGFMIKFVGSIMDLCLPWILAYMIDTIIPIKDKGQIYLWGLMMIVCSFLAVSFNIIANRMASKVARDTTEHIRNDLFEKVMYLSDSYMDTYTKPSIMSRLTTDTYNVHQMIGRIQRLGVRAPILLIGGIFVTLTLDPVLACVLIITLPFLAWIMIKVSQRSIPMYTKLQQSIDRFVRIVREDISGIRVIKALSKEDYERNRFENINHEVVGEEQKAGMLMAVIDPSVSVIMNLALVGVLIVGAFRVNSGLSEVGKILAFMTYFTIILNAMISISKMFVILSKAIASANRIDTILELEDDMEVVEALNTYADEQKYHVVFENVSFTYNKGEEDDLKDISFEVKQGETLGILGGTGAGKSTIVSLLLRFYDVKQGRILINGRDIKSIPLQELRSKFGVVFQNDMIFEDTILENVNLGRDLSEEEIEEALLYARAKEFVDQKTNNLEEALDIKGANLSGGQKQRILIARALAAHPEILVLDDSSSALDYQTDAMLRQELNMHFKKTTKIIVAQRVSSVMQADHIIVLEEGRMIGYGRHEELLAQCESYRQISASQMGGVA